MAIPHIATDDSSSQDYVNQAIDKANLVDKKSAFADVVMSLARPGESGSFFTASIDGAPTSLSPRSGKATNANDGSVAVVTAAGIVASIGATRIEPGRLYQVRYAVRRATNISDPDGDAIRLAVRALDAGFAPVATVLMADLLAVSTSSGRVERDFVIATAAADGVDVVLPAGTVYVRPFVQTYGSDGVTNVEIAGIFEGVDFGAFTEATITKLERAVFDAAIAPNGATAPEVAHAFVDARGFFKTYITTTGAIRSSDGILDISGLELMDDGNQAVTVTDEMGFVLSTAGPNGYSALAQLAAMVVNVGATDIMADDFDGIAVCDQHGFVRFAIGATGAYIADIDVGSADPDPPNPVPYFGPLLCGTSDVETSIYVSGMLADRADAPEVAATLLGVSGRAATASGDRLAVKTSDLGATATLATRPLDWSGSADQRRYLPLAVATAPVPAVSPATTNILLIGDSISNRQGALFLKQNLEDWDYIPNFIGTMHGDSTPTGANGIGGPLGECREGWETGDYTFAVIDRATPIAPGDEADYLSADKLDQWNQNPFIRASTSGDDPSIIRNDYVLDFEFYQSRFSLSTPDIVIYALGTNDVRDRTADAIHDIVYDNDTLILSRMRAAWPDAKIIRTVPGTAREAVRDQLWRDAYIPMISAMLEAVSDLADSKIFIAPVWAMVSQEAGYSLAAPAPDATTGAFTPSITDGVHPFGGTRAALFAALAAYVACASADLI